MDDDDDDVELNVSDVGYVFDGMNEFVYVWVLWAEMTHFSVCMAFLFLIF